MANKERYEINHEGMIVQAESALCADLDKMIISLFSQYGWTAEIVEKKGSCRHVHLKDGNGKSRYIYVYCGTIRNEARNAYEKKIQLGTVTDPKEKAKEDTLILGVYVYKENDGVEDAIFVGYPIDDSIRYDTNPSIRGTFVNQLLIDSKNNGFIYDKEHNTVGFRAPFIYYYLDNHYQLHYTSDKYPEVCYDSEEIASNDKFTPEWFKEKAGDYPDLDSDAATLLAEFKNTFAPEKLKLLEGKELLNAIFLNNENTDNLCRILEFSPKIKDFFGSIKGGSAYKYGLFFSSEGKWVAGTNRNPKTLSEVEAIEVGTKLRDALVAGAELIQNYDNLETLNNYKKLYNELNTVTEGHVNKSWFMKYYFMMFPELFASDYSDAAQRTVLSAIGENPEKYAIVRMGQIKLYTDKCGISNVMFNKIFWDNYSDITEDVEEDEISLEIKYKTNCDDKGFKRNRILFGAPGTGKSYTLNNDRKVLLYGEKDVDEDALDLSQYGGYERVTFHPDYSYASFVGTYKPVKEENEITYEFVPGPFMRVYVDALKSGRSEEAKPYLLIVEEINRANVAAVFGDVFQLLDREQNISEYPIMPSRDVKEYLAREDVLGGNPEDYKFIKIPDNMFIWATMNSADQGVFPMDTAFKRRWDFTYLGIDEAVETMSNEIKEKRYTLGSGTDTRCVTWNELRTYINGVLSSEDYNINEDKLLGPYFISRSILENATDEEFIKIFKNKVLMYLFDDAVKQKKKTFFEKCRDEIKGVRYSDICKQFDDKGVFIFPGKINETFLVKPENLGVEVDAE